MIMKNSERKYILLVFPIITVSMIYNIVLNLIFTFSFLMVILPILGEALLDVVKMLGSPADTGGAAVGVFPLLTGFAAAFASGCCACAWMISLVKRGKLLWFAIYCVIMGVICILWN